MAPRRRKYEADKWVPLRVYRGRSAYEWHPRDGGAVRLCALNATPAQVIRAYDVAVAAKPADNTFAWLVDEYFAAKRFTDLAAATQGSYRQCSTQVLPVFGHMAPGKITTAHIRQYMDRRGQASQYQANRELGFMHVVLQLGREKGLCAEIASKDVKKFKEHRRTNYVTDEEYAAVYAVAHEPIRVAMEIAYCTGLRRTDVINLLWSDVTADGLIVRQQKTQQKMHQALEKHISDRLAAALTAAKLLPKPEGITPIWIVHNNRGQQYTPGGFTSSWKTVIKKSSVHFTFHDLRRKAITDYDGDKRQDFSGHKSPQMADRYNVKPIKSPSH